MSIKASKRVPSNAVNQASLKHCQTKVSMSCIKPKGLKSYILVLWLIALPVAKWRTWAYKWCRIQTSTACSFAFIQALELGWKIEGHKLSWNVWGLFHLMWYIFKLEVLASCPEGSSHVQNYFIHYIFYHLQNTCIMDKQRNSRAASLIPQH